MCARHGVRPWHKVREQEVWVSAQGRQRLGVVG